MSKNQNPIIIKYYTRKLYDTESCSYTTQEKIAELIRKNKNILILSQKNGLNITVPMLWQIIFSAEKMQNFPMPLEILREIIQNEDGSISAYLKKKVSSAPDLQPVTLLLDKSNFKAQMCNHARIS